MEDAFIMINFIWAALVAAGVIYMMFMGKADNILDALMSGSSKAVEVCISLTGIYCFWLGIMNVAKSSGLIEKISAWLSPVMKKLFPHSGSKARADMSMNLSANILGLGNAATPFGLSAMNELKKDSGNDDVASDAMILFLILNTASLQLIPTTVISLRSSAGASAPASIILPSILATAIPCIVGVVLCKLLSKGK